MFQAHNSQKGLEIRPIARFYQKEDISCLPTPYTKTNVFGKRQLTL